MNCDFILDFTDKTPKKPIGIYQKFDYKYNYRKSIDKLRRCKYCKFIDNISNFFMYSKNIYKCKKRGYSHSSASDIRINNA